MQRPPIRPEPQIAQEAFVRTPEALVNELTDNEYFRNLLAPKGWLQYYLEAHCDGQEAAN